ncbi:hypothetical protein EUTSA_v10024019mg, partial [Eutrema salsugineum]
ILKKLPEKSLVRFQSVSKQWSSIISSRRDFIESIVTRSLTQPPRDAHIIFHKVQFIAYGRWGVWGTACLFGYDPLKNQYKVVMLPKYIRDESCQFFTLGDATPNQWRTIQSSFGLYCP